MEANQQRQIIEFQMMQQRAEQLDQQLKAVDQQIIEMMDLNDSIGKVSKGSEMLFPMGKGIYTRSKVEDEKLFINIGSGIIVKRTPSDAVKIIEEQIERLEYVKKEISREFVRVQADMQSIATSFS